MKLDVLRLLAGTAAALLLSAAPVARAEFIAISQPDSAAATQDGGPFNVASIFTVNSGGIVVTDIGIFASVADGTNPKTPVITATGPVEVGIYNANGSSAGINFMTLTTSNTEQYGSTGMVVLESFTPVTLAAGAYLVVTSDVGDIFSGAQATANTSGGHPAPNYETGPGLISFPSGGTYGYYSTYTGIPSIPAGPDGNQYTAGTFTFAAVPEPGSIVLIALGALGFWATARRRHCG